MFERRTISALLYLTVIISAGFLILYPLVNYNFPVCANVDERQSLHMLHKLEVNSFNPDLFNWPGFYFYITYFFMKLFGVEIAGNVSNTLQFCRILNLFNLCLLSIGVFILTLRFFKSRYAALIACFLTMFSPSLIYTSGYLCTDILMAVFIVFSMIFIQLFFEQKRTRYWIFAHIFMGFAISTKYTAVALVISYVIYFTFFLNDFESTLNTHNRSFFLKNFQNRFLFFSSGVASICFVIYFFYPLDLLQNFISANGLINSRLEQSDIVFLHSFKLKFLTGGIFWVIFSLLCIRVDWLRKKVSQYHIYVGLLISLIAFLIGSPFTIIAWKKFLYMFCAHLKMNTFYSDQKQFSFYLKTLINHESIVVLLVFITALVSSYLKKIKIGFLVIYLSLYAVLTGTATIGFIRYLVPCLPVMFTFASWGIVFLVTELFKQNRTTALIVTAILLVVLPLELMPKIRWVFKQYSGHDEMYASYKKILDLKPDKIYYSRFLFVPTEELEIQYGFDVEELPYNSLYNQDHTIFQRISNNQILILHKETNAYMSDFLKKNFVLVWEDLRNFGQFIYTKPSRTYK